MIWIAVIYFAFYSVSLGLVIAVGYAAQRAKERKYHTGEKKIDPKDVVVLIPFRNEAHRIGELLDSINKLRSYPAEFVFIDDHSNDDTAKLIEDKIERAKYQVLSCPEGITGKKKALRYATEQTNSLYILTIDADVILPDNYFDRFSEYSEADMYVLAAVLKPSTFLEYFYEIDVVLVTAANAGLSGLARPIMASGANLFYKRETFNKVDDIQSHIHAASGDDTYLLRDFRHNKSDVRLLSDPDCAVTTETPRSFKEFIDQRLRWIGKTGDIKDNLSTFLAVLQALLTVIFFSLIVYALVLGDIKYFVMIFAAKTAIDMLLFLPYFNRIRRLSSWLLIPVYELFFPLYTILLMVLLLTYKPKWKGREIYSNKKAT
jgi:cellulose synthase/poly-beta-1,6-N-acetylglucosamine synthase-like glycosyltransferase